MGEIGACIFFVQLMVNFVCLNGPHYMKTPYDRRAAVVMDSWLSKDIAKVMHCKQFLSR